MKKNTHDLIVLKPLHCLCATNYIETVFQNFQMTNGRITNISGHFFANYMDIFHKTEIQTVNLRCLPSLNLNWYKSYDAKPRNVKNTNMCFCTKSQKK